MNLKEVAKLMTAVPFRDGRENKDGKPRWTAEQFVDALNSSIKLASARKGKEIEPITLEQAEKFLAEGRDVFEPGQYEVFERWAKQRMGLSHLGPTFAPPTPNLKMNCEPVPVLLPKDFVYVDNIGEPFKDRTNHRARSKLGEGATVLPTG